MQKMCFDFSRHFLADDITARKGKGSGAVSHMYHVDSAEI